MPVYVYACKNCGHRFEQRQSFSDDTLTVCPVCHESALHKVYDSVGVVFKGSGFYSTDSHSAKTGPSSAHGADGESSSGSGESTGSTGSDSHGGDASSTSPGTGSSSSSSSKDSTSAGASTSAGESQSTQGSSSAQGSSSGSKAAGSGD